LKVSITSVIYLILASFFLLFFRLLLPVGDEPDWHVRVFELQNFIYPVYSPFFYLRDLIDAIEIDYNSCQLVSSPTSLWSYIPTNCSSSFNDSVYRLLITIFLVFPIIWLLIFRKLTFFLLKQFHSRITKEEVGYRLDSLLVFLLMPGSLYYLGLLSIEAFFVVISLFVFLFWNSIGITLALFIILFFVDVGNFLVVFLFYSVMLMSGVVYDNFGKKIFFVFLFFFVLTGLTLGSVILPIIYTFFDGAIAAKASLMEDALIDGYYHDKYPIILRPVISFMTIGFMTPSGVKSLFLYIVLAVIFVKLFFDVLKSNNKIFHLYFFVPISTVFFFVLFLPIYANGKYYIFLIPFFAYVAIILYGRLAVFFVASLMSFIVAFNLLLYRIG